MELTLNKLAQNLHQQEVHIMLTIQQINNAQHIKNLRDKLVVISNRNIRHSITISERYKLMIFLSMHVIRSHVHALTLAFDSQLNK